MDRNFFHIMKKILRDWDVKVMSYVMVVVTAVCVFTATVAWFTMSAAGSIREIQFKTANTEVIKVAVEENGEDIEVLRTQGENPIISLTMPNFSNVATVEGAEHVLAPGVYGQATIYVTPIKQGVSGCRIVPSFYENNGAVDEDEISFVDGLDYTGALENLTEEQQETEKEILKNLVQGHILFFADEDYNIPITQENPLELPLTWDDEAHQGVEEEIIIYWYWPYEYEDIPESVRENIADTTEATEGQLSRDLFFDPDKEEEGKYTDARLYDYADTRIGSYVESMRFHFEVSAGYEQDGN